MIQLKSYFNFRLEEFISPKSVIDSSASNLDRNLFLLAILGCLLATYVLNIQGVHHILVFKKTILLILPILLFSRVLILRRLNIWFFPLSVFILLYFGFT